MDLLLPLQALASLLILLLLYNLLLSKARMKKLEPNNPPEPSGSWPFIGHLHLLGGREPVARILGAMADKHGPAFMLRMGLNPTLVVSSWEVAKECFTTNDKIFASRPSFMAGKLLGYNYAMFGFAPYGAYWREIRKIATLEVLSNKQLESMKHIRANEIGMCVKEIYDMWAKKSQQPVMVEMKQWFGNLTFNVTVMMVAGKRCFGANVAGNEEEARRFRHGISELLRLTGVFVAGDALPFLKWLDLEGHEKAMKKTAKDLDGLMGLWLEEHRLRKASGHAGVKDFMDVLISIIRGSTDL